MAARRRVMLCSVHLLEGAAGKPRAALIRRPVAAACSGASCPNTAAAAEVTSSCVPLKSSRLQELPSWTFMRAMSCCAGLGSPPPREIVVEYSSCSDGNEGDDYTDEFIKLANAIEDAYPEFVVSGNPDMIQPRKGAFEIRIGDSILFSKLKMKRLPDLTEILKAINALPPLQCELS